MSNNYHITTATDRIGFQNTFGHNYTSGFGANLSTFFKPFTTQINVSGIPHYQVNIFTAASGTQPSGTLKLFNVSASGLNPYGPNTVGENIISGSGAMPQHLQFYMDPNSVRSFGHKNPSTWVGWGYDIFGYPSPNLNAAWNLSGSYSNTVPTSSSGFMVTATTGSTHGRDVPSQNWNAGPLDVRWDIHRKIWTAPQSVYSSTILATYVSGILQSPVVTGNYFAQAVTYDAQIFDGVANTFTVTGVTHIGPKPLANTYKVRPLSSGDFSFIVHALINSKPSLALWLVEPPGAEECLSQNTTASNALNFLSDSTISYGALSSEPLDDTYGGTGYNSYASGQILMGRPSGDLGLFTLCAGSGIVLNLSSPTGGIITFALSSGVAFIAGGVNNTITELQGLTTPLSISGGGIGTNYKSFVDTYSVQSVGATKTFTSGIAIGSYGSATSPVLYFQNMPRAGLFLTSGVGLNICSSGGTIISMTPTGFTFNNVNIIDCPSIPSGVNTWNYAPLIVKEFGNSPLLGQYIQIWRDHNNIDIGAFSPSGGIVLGASGARNILLPCSTGGYINTMPTGSGPLALASQVSGYTGDIAVNYTSGSVTGRILHVLNGLITGFSNV